MLVPMSMRPEKSRAARGKVKWINTQKVAKNINY